MNHALPFANGNKETGKPYKHNKQLLVSRENALYSVQLYEGYFSVFSISIKVFWMSINLWIFLNIFLRLLMSNNCKTLGFGSWLCFCHQMKPHNPVTWVHGMKIRYLHWTQLTVVSLDYGNRGSFRNVVCFQFYYFLLIYEGICLKICTSLMTQLCKKSLDIRVESDCSLTQGIDLY